MLPCLVGELAELVHHLLQSLEIHQNLLPCLRARVVL